MDNDAKYLYTWIIVIVSIITNTKSDAAFQ